jgi:hypothetical protein
MNKTLTLILLITIGPSTAFAYIPTIDSLFRNGNNIDIGDSTVVASLVITKVSQNENEELITDQPKRSAHKFLLTSGVVGISDFLQVDYRDALFSKETINEIKRRNKLDISSFSGELFETKLFYSLLKSLLLNESDLMISFLNKIDPKILPNKKLLNKDQLTLLNKYKKYLKELSEGTEGLENPLLPIDEEKKEEIKEVLSKSLIADESNIKRLFENKNFYLTYKSDVLELKFENETHQLKNMNIKNGDSEIQVEMMNYVLFTNGFEFPEEISIKLANGDQFQIVLKKLQIINDTEQTYFKRINAYKKQIKSVEDKIMVMNKPLFVL